MDVEPGHRWDHGSVSSIAVNPRDPGTQGYSRVPSGSLHLYPQHPDASGGLPVQVRIPQVACGRPLPYLVPLSVWAAK